VSIESLMRRASAYTLVDRSIYEEKVNIMVVGIGGAGCNAISRMKTLGLSVPTVAINTDLNNLRTINADKKILLKKYTRGLGSGGIIEIGEKSAILASNELKGLFDGMDVVFITTGLGGGTGTGATPIIADMARNEGALVITIATMPFKIEKARFLKAKEGLKRIVDTSNTLIIMENDKLMEIAPNLPITKAFLVMDQLISYTIMSFIDVLTKPSLMNIDLSDLRRIMSHGGFSTILIGEGDAVNPRKIVIDALNRPLIMDMDYSKATGGIIHITTGEDVPLSAVYSAVDAISSIMENNSNMMIGARIDQKFENKMRVLVLLTGIKIPILEEEYEIKRETSYNAIKNFKGKDLNPEMR
jgi:cell division protein FtsZ